MIDIEKEREAFSRWVLTHSDNLDITSYEENIMFDAWQAAKAQAVPEIQQSKQDEIDDLKAQLKAVHDSRIAFVEYCRMIEVAKDLEKALKND